MFLLLCFVATAVLGQTTCPNIEGTAASGPFAEEYNFGMFTPLRCQTGQQISIGISDTIPAGTPTFLDNPSPSVDGSNWFVEDFSFAYDNITDALVGNFVETTSIPPIVSSNAPYLFPNALATGTTFYSNFTSLAHLNVLIVTLSPYVPGSSSGCRLDMLSNNGELYQPSTLVSLPGQTLTWVFFDQFFDGTFNISGRMDSVFMCDCRLEIYVGHCPSCPLGPPMRPDIGENMTMPPREATTSSSNTGLIVAVSVLGALCLALLLTLGVLSSSNKPMRRRRQQRTSY